MTFGIALFAQGPAKAEERGAPTPLVWEAPLGCPGQEDVMREVSRLTSRGVGARAEARVDKSENGWRLRMTVRRASEPARERQLGFATCQDAASAAAFLLALALDPTLDPVAPKPVLEPPALPPAELGFPTAFDLRLHGGLDLGVLRRVAPTLALGLGISSGRFLAAVDLQATAPQTVGDGVELLPLGAVLRGCVALVEQPFRISPCLGGTLHLVQSDGPFRSNLTPWGSALASVDGAFPFTKNGNVFMSARLDLGFPFARPEFLNQNTSIYEVSPVLFGGRLGIGAWVR